MHDLESAESVAREIDRITQAAHPVHPFELALPPERLEPILAEYLAVTTALPYIRAGAVGLIAFDRMATGDEFEPSDDLTFAMTMMAAWHEIGGTRLVLECGTRGLPLILDTGEHFDSSLLRLDVSRLLGKDVQASFSPVTRRYLFRLHAGFADLDIIGRAAFLVSQHTHATRMLTALIARIRDAYGVSAGQLAYFNLHVDDPTHASRTETLLGMIPRAVPPSHADDFYQRYEAAYTLHTWWCESITTL
ncbi:hypothetical protein [Streptomyces chartreusis]|uniref:hypothetical protein n=1 Tax=Streptomyces chartreusis TaxID=1969 RepID=UPI002E1750A1